MKEKLRASILGFIIGDALGVPVEFKSREYLEQNPVVNMMENKSRNTTKGYWSDDTAMTLCTMQSLIECNDNNITLEIAEDMLNKYREWVEKGYKAVDNKCFGIGQNTLRVLSNYKKSKSITDYLMNNNPEDEKKGGNGALMRILPLVLYLYYNDLPKYNEYDSEVQRCRKYDVIEFTNDLTHNNKDSRNCCFFYTMFIFNLLDTGDIYKSYEKAINDCMTRFNGFPSKKLERILLNKLIDLDKSEIKSSGYVVDTLEASLWCLFNTHSYEEAVLTAVNLGVDSDTIGAITGSLAGLYYGIEQIPEKWINTLREKEMLDNDINKFLNKILLK